MYEKSMDNESYKKSVNKSEVEVLYSKAESYMWQQQAIEPGAGTAYAYAQPQEMAESEVYQSVDPYTLEIIAQLFPAPTNGIDFLARLLRHAQIVQEVLPGLEELGDFVAIINTRTIRLLAKAIHMAYDTTHKYVATFCALNLLHKHKHNQQRQLVFPLQRYTPPRDLNALEHLITQSRPKLQQFARGVKKRFLKLNLGLSELLEPSTALPVCDSQTIKSLFPSIVNLLQAEGIELQHSQHLAKRLMGEVISKVLPLHAGTQKPESTLSLQESTGSTSEGRPETERVATKGGLFSIAGSKEKTLANKKSTPGPKEKTIAQKVSLFQHSEPREVQKSTPKVDSQTTQAQTQTQQSTQKTWQSTQEIQQATQKVDPQPAQAQTWTRQEPEPDTICEVSIESPDYDPMGDLLELYYNLLTDISIDWTHSGLPKTFISELYEILVKNYDNLKAKGLLANMRGSLWVSVESSIIRRLAAKYAYDFKSAYNFLQYCTYRSDTYQAPRYLGTSTTEVDYATPAPQESPEPCVTVDQAHNAYTPESNEQYETVDQPDNTDALESTDYPETVDQPDSEDTQESTWSGIGVDSDPIEATTESTDTVDSKKKKRPRKSTQKTGKSLLERKTELLAMFDITPEDIADGVGANLLDMSIEDLRVQAKQYQDKKLLWQKVDEEAEKEKQGRLSIPKEFDNKHYTEEAYYVIRKRNVTILFNNFYNNITLRKELKTFLAEVFDNKHTKKADDWYKVVDECSAEQLCAGFIDTLVILHSPSNKRIARPGAFFISRCRTIRDHGMTADTQRRVGQYAELTYSELLEELERSSK